MALARAAPWIRPIAGLSSRRLGFAPGYAHVRYVMDKWHWDRVFCKFFCSFLSVSFFRGYPSSVEVYCYEIRSWLLQGMRDAIVSGSCLV
jgi:hypothetical protein